ncbi:hypothetical protein BCI9360_02321 [Bacillus sp. CECT 9360]|nr:hypothetical protein BCI9360_02321 [Bacillus sp. CECT 9360]
MDKINHFISHLEHNYLLIAIAAILFFLLKAAAGYITYNITTKSLNRLKTNLTN